MWSIFDVTLSIAKITRTSRHALDKPHQPHVAVFGHNRPLPVPSLSLSGSLKPQQSTSRDKGPHFSLTSDSKDFHSTSTATRCVPEIAGAIDWWSVFVDKHRSGRPTSPYTTIICFSLYLGCCVTAVYKRGTSGLGSLCSCIQRSLLAFYNSFIGRYAQSYTTRSFFAGSWRSGFKLKDFGSAQKTTGTLLSNH